jgi:amino acid adenylation domain-containing protein
MKCAHERIAVQTAATPGAKAIISATRVASYEEMDVWSNAVAGAIKQQGISPGSIVAVYCDSSVESVIALLAVLKIGAMILPLSVNEPKLRLEWMLSQTNPSVVITTEPLANEVPPRHKRFVLEPLDRLKGASGSEPTPQIGFDSPACILYTSGSSGTPKGVIRTHRGLVSRLDWMDIRDEDVFCHNMPLGAGFSQERLFVPLMRGVPLIVLPESHFGDPELLATDVEIYGITQLTLVPIMLRRILDLGPKVYLRMSGLRTLTCGGAELAPDLITRFRKALPSATLLNTYGGTETGTITYRRISGELEPSSSIGCPLPSSKLYICDESLNLIEQGGVGEMYVGAPSLASGYWNDPQLTAERFLPNPFNVASGERIYKTGDLGRMLPNGEIEFHGRVDRQVKVRGYRVEVAEVEGALEQCDSVLEAAVTAQKIGLEARLAAYLVLTRGRSATVGTLRSQLSSFIPDYMMPYTFVALKHLPRLPGGKVDFSSLPAVEKIRPILDVPYREPEGAIENALTELWEEVLGITGIGADDNFIELGGDSLSAARVIVEIIVRFNKELPLDLLFEPGTIAYIADQLESVKQMGASL